LLVIPAKAGIQLSMKNPCVYILASGWDGTLYVGVTSALVKRVWEHKNDVVEGFTRQHGVHNLVWFEQHMTIDAAILREKAIKEWKRDGRSNSSRKRIRAGKICIPVYYDLRIARAGFRLSPE
jgi:putative endonuclease